MVKTLASPNHRHLTVWEQKLMEREKQASELSELQQPDRNGNGKNACFPQPQVPDGAGTETDGAQEAGQ